MPPKAPRLTEPCTYVDYGEGKGARNWWRDVLHAEDYALPEIPVRHERESSVRSTADDCADADLCARMWLVARRALTPTERMVTRRRRKGCTLEAIASAIGKGRQRVRQIDAHAVRKMEKAIYSDRIRDPYSSLPDEWAAMLAWAFRTPWDAWPE